MKIVMSERLGTSDLEKNGMLIDAELRRHPDWEQPNLQLDQTSQAAYDKSRRMLDYYNEVTRPYSMITVDERHKRLEHSYRALEIWRHEIVNPSYLGKRAFAVGRRQRMTGAYGSASESDDFLPTLANDNGGTPYSRSRLLDTLPPAVLARSGEDGVVVMTQLSPDMETYAKHDLAGTLTMRARAIQQLARFVTERGIELVGLAGEIPGQSGFGAEFRETPGLAHELHTTTGHAGTVWLIKQGVEDLKKRAEYVDETTIGILGAGSIGRAAGEALLGDGSLARKIVAFDSSKGKVRYQFGAYEHSGRVEEAESMLSLLQSSEAKIIVSAVTTFVDLDDLEREHNTKIDLAGKVIMDDSQPAAFSLEQVESRGGKLMWVIGSDQSADGFATRRGGDLTYSGRPFAYGGEGIGMAEDEGEEGSTVFGCEAELAALSRAGRLDLALRGRVDFRDPKVQETVEIIQKSGIRTARPQAYGRIVRWGMSTPDDSPSHAAAA